jgi:hypothetical protein
MPPLALTDAQMDALLAASHPLPCHARAAFLEHCARELAALPELGDGVLHRVVTQVQRIYFDPPLSTESGRRRMPGVGKYG